MAPGRFLPIPAQPGTAPSTGARRGGGPRQSCIAFVVEDQATRSAIAEKFTVLVGS